MCLPPHWYVKENKSDLKIIGQVQKLNQQIESSNITKETASKIIITSNMYAVQIQPSYMTTFFSF